MNQPNQVFTQSTHWQTTEMLNRAHEALMSAEQSSVRLQQLMASAPTLHGSIRHALFAIFGADSDQMSLTFKPPAPNPNFSRSLSEIAAQLQREPGLEVPDDAVEPNAVFRQALERMNLTLDQALLRVKSANLEKQLVQYVTEYWKTSADADTRSRLQVATQLRQASFFDKAQVAYATEQLSAKGLRMARAVVEFPIDTVRRIEGGDMAGASASEVNVSALDGTTVRMAGALVIGEDVGEQVLYIPGFEQEIFEYPSRAELAQALNDALASQARNELWRLLEYGTRNRLLSSNTLQLQQPLRFQFALIEDNPFQRTLLRSIRHEFMGALSLARGEAYELRGKEVIDISGTDALTAAASIDAGRAQRFGYGIWRKTRLVLSQRLAIDAIGHSRDVSFASLSIDVPQRLRQQKLEVYDAAIAPFVGAADKSTPELRRYREAYSLWQAAHDKCEQIGRDLINSNLELDEGFWTWRDENLSNRTDVLVQARGEGLLQEALLQKFEKQLTATEYARIEDVVRTGAGSVVTRLCIKAGENTLELGGALVFTTTVALSSSGSAEPAMLFVPGKVGGLQKFRTLAELKARVARSLEFGAQTVLVRLLSMQARSRLPRVLATESIVTPVIEANAIAYSVQAQLDSYTEQAGAAQGGERPYTDAATLGATVQRLRLDTASNLSVPQSQARDSAFAKVTERRRKASARAKLPQWLRKAAPQVQLAYASQLRIFSRNLASFERQLTQRLTDLAVFTRQQLVAQLKADLNVDIDPDQVLIDIPDKVAVHTYGDAFDPAEEVPSTQRTVFTLARLAQTNLNASDGQMLLRMKYARITHGKGAATAEGITSRYLIKTIPALDVAGQYQRRVMAAYALGEGLAGGQAEWMLKPYQQAMDLEAIAAREQHWLSEQEYVLLITASAARTAEGLLYNGFDIGFYRLRLKADADAAQASPQTLIGPLCLQDRKSGKTLIYLPNVPQGRAFLAANSLEQARQLLIEAAGQPAMAAYLAGSGRLNTELQDDLNDIADGLKNNGAGLFAFEPVAQADATLSTLLLETARDRLIRQVHGSARSQADIARENRLAWRQEVRFAVKTGLSLVPGLGALVFFDDAVSHGAQAADAYRHGHIWQGLGYTALVALDVCFAILSVIPAVGAIATAIKSERVALNTAAKIARGGKAAPVKKNYVIQPFEGYDVDVNLRDAKAQAGTNAGTYKLAQQLYIVQDDRVYAVYRRSGEQTLRLKAVGSKGYEQPIRLGVDGRWEYHSDVGLKGGGRTPEALIDEVFFEGAGRQVFAAYAFPESEADVLKLRLARYVIDWLEWPANLDRYLRFGRRPVILPSTTSDFWDSFMTVDRVRQEQYSEQALQRQEGAIDGLAQAPADAEVEAGIYDDGAHKHRVFIDAHGAFQADTIRFYTDDDDVFNKFLREGVIEYGDPIKYIRDLEEELNVVGTNDEVALYRGGSGNRGTSGVAFRSGTLKVGDVLVNTDIASFSESPFIARRFASSHAGNEIGEQAPAEFDDTSVIFKLNREDYFSATPIAPFSKTPSEAESVFLPGCYFKITSLQEVRGANYRFMEVGLSEINPPANTPAFDLRTGELFNRDRYIQKLGEAARGLVDQFFPLPQG